jgi:crotonobetainyl-CoA:carnitine CoA-transferase CaiB-like acyl-CoA transferase
VAEPAVLTRTDSPVECVVEWAGPIELPLRGEADVQAACGIMHVHGRRYGHPTQLGFDYASIAAGVLAAQGVLAARLAAVRGIPVRRVTTSAAQAALLAVSQYLAAATAADPEDDFAPGGPPFESADGVRFELETLDAQAWQRFWQLLGADPAAVSQGWRPFQQRFATATCPLPAPLHTATHGVGFAELAAFAAAAGVSLVPVREIFPAEEMRPWRISRVPGSLASPGLGTGTGLPLDGLVVVESCRRVQGPLAGHLLRLLGATVTRIEPPGGDPARGVPPMAGDCSARHLALNRGKRVVEIDITTPAGRRGVHELVSGADVFLHNWAPGKAAALALDADQLSAARPGLVYAAASGWGDLPRPPLGTDYVVQAHTGIGALVNPDRPEPSLMTLTDVLGGLVCAAGVLAGLLARARTGEGQRVDSSLLSAALVCRPSRPPLPAVPGVEIRTDLAGLAADPCFRRVLEHDGCCFVRAPWEFEA